MQADKTVSLNEAQRLKEIRDNEARAKARERERIARLADEPKVYEISLKQADLPGLPPPVAKTNAVADANSEVGAADEEKAPSVDVDLDEAEQILADYLALESSNSVAAAKK